MINVKFKIPRDALLPYLYIDIYIYIIYTQSNFIFFNKDKGMKRICQFKIKKNNI